MSTAVRDAVLLWLARNGELPHHPLGERGAPVFALDDDGTVHWVSGRPDITLVSLDVLELAGDDALGWDGNHITMPGNLRYRPLFINLAGDAVVARRVGP